MAAAFHQKMHFLLLLSGLLATAACRHQPMLPGDPSDPTNPNPPDTTQTGIPCQPNLVYFEQQVLPILQSNCAFSGCHNEASAQDGVVLTSYQRVMQTADVRPFQPNNSDLYEAITDNDPDKRMPPPPAARLSSAQTDLIRQWIAQGALNLPCDPDAGACNTTQVSYAADLRPVLQNHCLGCHSVSAPSGGVQLGTHAGIAAAASSGRLLGAMAREAGYPAMPPAGNALSDCQVDKFRAWVAAGSPNN